VLVQGALAQRGYYDGQIDGVAGPGTRSAIREFQRDNGLPVTGRIDSQLVQALKNGRD
jgi:peptidoglycan hydrolase-like protein with peptidoglycan-binding domain